MQVPRKCQTRRNRIPRPISLKPQKAAFCSSSSHSPHQASAAPGGNMAESPTIPKDDPVTGTSSIDDGSAGLPSASNNDGGGAWEIEEMEPEARPPLQGASSTNAASSADDVYVAVGKGGSSMAALSWALRRLTKPRSFVYLVHVFPVVTSIPTPLGMMPKSRASPEQIETYLSQERSKRREMLQKFLDQCRNFQVNVDVYLIESDQIANAITELIPVLHIKQLVLGVSKSNVRKLKRGSTIAGQVQKIAPLYCEVKIICDGKEVTTVAIGDPTPPLSPSPVNNSNRSNNPTPPSSTPNHDNGATNGDRNGSETRERKKIAKFLRCISF